MLKRGSPVIQYRPPLLPRAGILRERRGENAIVEFDGVRRLVRRSTLKLVADLRNELDNDNVGT